MPAEIVDLRAGAPLLSDVPGMLRRLADQIEAGQHGAVTSALLLIPVEDDYPKVFGWGVVEGDRHPAIQCELAKSWLLSNLTRRAI